MPSVNAASNVATVTPNVSTTTSTATKIIIPD